MDSSLILKEVKGMIIKIPHGKREEFIAELCLRARLETGRFGATVLRIESISDAKALISSLGCPNVEERLGVHVDANGLYFDSKNFDDKYGANAAWETLFGKEKLRVSN